MKEIERIVDQSQRAFNGGAWHGPSVMEILKGITATRASAKPLAGGHCIWEMVLHVSAWEDFVRRRLGGERVIDPSPEEDWPPVCDRSETAWNKLLKEIETRHQILCNTISTLEDARLTEKVPGMTYSFYFMLQGVVQHNLYHAGQIALLKKAAKGVTSVSE